MITTKEITLDTSKGQGVFEVPQLNGVQGMKLFIRLTNKLGPALAHLKSGDKNTSRAAVFASVLERVTPDEYEQIQNELLARVSARFPASNEVDSNVIRNLGEIFTGSPFELGRLVLFALEVNYGSFFDAIKNAVQKELSKAQIPTPSVQAS